MTHHVELNEDMHSILRVILTPEFEHLMLVISSHDPIHEIVVDGNLYTVRPGLLDNGHEMVILQISVTDVGKRPVVSFLGEDVTVYLDELLASMKDKDRHAVTTYITLKDD